MRYAQVPKSIRWQLLGVPLLALILLATLGQARASAAEGFQKTLPLNAWELGDAKLGEALDLAKSAGVTQIQTGGIWWWMTRAGTPRSYDWSGTDRLVAAAERRGMRVVMQLSGTPDWVHPDLTQSVSGPGDRTWYPPVRNATELGHWSDFVADVAGRYRGRVAHYEIWNEPNWSSFWKPGPDVDAYARLLRTAYHAVKGADPAAAVVFGGMDRNDSTFLRAYYESVERQWPAQGPASRFFFDVLGVHPYSDGRSPRVNDPAHVTGGVDRNFIGFRRLKQLMDAREGPGKRIYLGEYGFSTTKTWMPAVPDETRAQYLRDAYALAAAESYVTGMSWYHFVPDSANGPEWSAVGHDLRPSRTFEALRTSSSAPVPSLIEPSGQIESGLVVNLKTRKKVRYRRTLARGLKVRISCSRQCAIDARVVARRRGAGSASRVFLGRSRRSAKGSETRTVRLKLRARAARKALRGNGRKVVRLTIEASDGNGGSASAKQIVRVVRGRG